MKTMSPEIDRWLEEYRARHPDPLAPVSDEPLPKPVARGAPVPACPLTEAEIDWLWPRYQRCGFPPATFAKRFARTDREKLTARGKNACVSLSYRYRRQILGPAAAKLGHDEFLSAVRVAAAAVGKV